jgi:hypothetical protein
VGDPGEKKPFIEQVFEDQSGLPPADDDADADGRYDMLEEPETDASDGGTASGAATEGEPGSTDVELSDEVGLDPLLALTDLPPLVEMDAGDKALIGEAMKKSGLIWVTSPVSSAGRAFWHVWLDDTAYVLTGPEEQPDPGWPNGVRESVVVRSKDNSHRLLTFDVLVSEVRPDDDDWEAASSALAAGRLNLRDADGAPTRWAAGGAVLYRLRLAGRIAEGPGRYSAESHRAAPVPSTATTQGDKPWVLHKRGHRGRPLS